MDQRDRKCGADFIFLTLSLFRNFHESTLQVSVVLIMMLIWVTQGKSVPSWYVCTEKKTAQVRPVLSLLTRVPAHLWSSR